MNPICLGKVFWSYPDACPVSVADPPAMFRAVLHAAALVGLEIEVRFEHAAYGISGVLRAEPYCGLGCRDGKLISVKYYAKNFTLKSLWTYHFTLRWRLADRPAWLLSVSG